MNDNPTRFAFFLLVAAAGAEVRLTTLVTEQPAARFGMCARGESASIHGADHDCPRCAAAIELDEVHYRQTDALVAYGQAFGWSWAEALFKMENEYALSQVEFGAVGVEVVS